MWRSTDTGFGRLCGFPPGILGHSHRHFETLDFDMPGHAVLITASDGIRKSWDVGAFPGLWRTHPQLIAFFLGEVIGRNNDDKSIFAIRASAHSSASGGLRVYKRNSTRKPIAASSAVRPPSQVDLRPSTP